MNKKELLTQAAENRYEEMLETLQECIRIPSVAGEAEDGAPYGRDVRRCLDFVLDKAEELGFRVKNVDGHAGYCEYGEGEMVAAVAHLDVVPAGDGWTFPPFGAEIRDGRVYGRGAVDDKGPAMCVLYALAAVKDTALSLKKRIRIIFGTNEENGSSDLRYYKEHGGELPTMGFTPDGYYPLVNGEKGIINVSLTKRFTQSGDFRLVSLRGGTAANVVPAKAEAVIECPGDLADEIAKQTYFGVAISVTDSGLLVQGKGKEAHGSTPEEGVNAIALLIKALKDMPFSKELKDTFEFIDKKIGLETNGESLGIALRDDISGTLSLNLGVIKGGSNALTIVINYRYPVTKTYMDCGPKLNGTFQRAGFTCTEQLHEGALYIPKESVLVSRLLAVYREQTGVSAEPIAIGGGTYAKSFENVAAFGPVFPGDPDVEHKADEYAELETLKKNLKIYTHALYSLAN